MCRRSLTEQAKNFDAWYQEGGGEAATIHHRLVYQTVYQFHKHGVQSVLDVGCGRGMVLAELARQGFELTGTEICPSLLERDLKRMPVYPYSIAALSQFEDQSFDLVLLVDLLESLRDQREVDECIEHADRLARKGILVTFGGLSTKRIINEPNDFWREALGDLLDFPVDERIDKVTRAVRLVFWRNE